MGSIQAPSLVALNDSWRKKNRALNDSWRKKNRAL